MRIIQELVVGHDTKGYSFETDVESRWWISAWKVREVDKRSDYICSWQSQLEDIYSYVEVE